MTPQPPTSHFAMSAHRRSLVRRAAIVVAAVLAVGGTPLVAVALGADADDASIAGKVASTEVSPNWAPTEPARNADGPPARLSEFETPASGLALDADPLTAAAAARSARADEGAAQAAEAAEAARAAEAAKVAEAEAAAAAAEAARAEAAAAALLVVSDTYQWDERSPRVAALQQLVGAEPDGWYAWATLRAHRGALEALGMPTGSLPVPPAPPAPAPVADAPSVSSSSGPSASAWAALRNCESGGNYSITNPSGKYRGAYQFDQSTWDSIARRHAPGLVGVDPAGASPSSQDAMAQALYSERGSDPWPQCGRHL